jgi:hypothetical protein
MTSTEDLVTEHFRWTSFFDRIMLNCGDYAGGDEVVMVMMMMMILFV